MGLHRTRTHHEELGVHVSFYEIYGGRLFDLFHGRKVLMILAAAAAAVDDTLCCCG